MTPFAAIILAALVHWTSGRIPAETLEPWASAMVDACTSERECIQLAALAFEETGFSAPAIDGRCNDPAWRAAQRGWWRGSCDGGLAWGPWQLHDAAAIGASPNEQALIAVAFLRQSPRAWTTWDRARALADRWLARR